MSSTSAQHFDVLVIGSGAGGAPVAALLAERGRKVGLIEAGGPVLRGTPEEALDRYYLHRGFTLATGGGGVVSILAGEALGGTTVINSGTCLDPPDEVLRAWDRKAQTKLADELPEHVARVKEDIGVTVPPKELLGPSHHLFAQGIASLGLPEPFVLPRNAPDCKGSGLCCFVCPTSAKRSMDVSYLPRARAAGAHIFDLTRAEHVVPNGKGVRVQLKHKHGEELTLTCDELVIAGGTLSTPRLLRGSKLGSAWKRAGDEMTIHPASKVVAAFPHAVHGERGVPQGMGLKLPQLPSIAFEGIFTPAEALVPLLVGAGSDLNWWLDRHDKLASFGLMCTDHTTGWVRWHLGMPIMRYTVVPEDGVALIEGFKLMARAFLRAGAERVFLPFMAPGNEVSNERELDAIDAASIAPRRILATGFHPLGTAGLGRVVDGELRLLGEPRIRVCDGSVLPGAPGVNPQLTIMGLARYLVDRMAPG